MPKRLFVLLFCFFVAGVCCAQTFSDSFEFTHPEEDDFRDIAVDRSLFNALLNRSETRVYDSAVRYAFRFTQMRHRGLEEAYTRRLAGYSDITERVNKTPDYAFLSALYDVSSAVRYGFDDSYSGMLYGSNFSVNYLTFPEHESMGRGYAIAGYSNRRDRADIKFGTQGKIGEGDWSYAVRGSVSLGHDSNMEGVFGNSLAFSVGAIRRLRDGSVFSAFVFAAPVEAGVRMWTTKEAFELTGDNLYNPSWGRWSDGSIRNSRVRRNFTPLWQADYLMNPSDATSLRFSAAAVTGTKRYSTLDWWNAPNPYPDYYSYLPSAYADPQLRAVVGERWCDGDEKYTQIDWETIRRINVGFDGERSGSAYILGDRVERVADFNLSVAGSTMPDGGIRVDYAVGFRNDNRRFYKQAKDMLGGDFVLNIDRFELLRNNIESRDDRIHKGDRYDYDYTINRQELNVRLGGCYDTGALSLFWNGELSFSSLFRRGNFSRESVRDSYGRSVKLSRAAYDLRLGGAYSFRNGVTFSASLFTSSYDPHYETVFLYPVISNSTFSNIASPVLSGGELSFAYNALHWLHFDVSGYYRMTSGVSRVFRYYDDFFGQYAIMLCEGEKWASKGIEVGVGVSLFRQLELRAAASLNGYTYQNDAGLTIINGNQFTPLLTNGVARLRGYVPVTSPERLFVMSLRYRPVYRLFIEMNYQHVSHRHVSLNPLRRATHITTTLPSPESLAVMVAQERLPSAGTLNLFVMWRYTAGKDFEGSVSLSVMNLLGRSDIIYGGYEQTRLSRDTVSGSYAPFASKYAYHYPRIFILTVSCNI